MSKAFTKEDSGQDDDDQSEELKKLPQGKNYITPGGLKRLRDELSRLIDVERPEVVRIVSWAASNGDRSENGDYIYGKRKLREIDKRIRFLSKRIEIAVAVDPTKQENNRKICFGARVMLLDESEVKKTYTIVGIDETDVAKGRISWISPMGKALLQGSKGEIVTLRTPKGEEDLEILEVHYETIE